MKKYLAGLVVTLMLLAVMPASAQYGQYDSPGQSNQHPPPYPPNDGQYGQQPNPPQPGDRQSAQQGDQQNDQSDENQPGMARLSYMQGDVSSQRGDNGDWVAATVNTPLAVNDRVSTGQKSRAEIQLDYADVLRMSGSATAKIANLTRNAIQVQIGQGLVTYSVLKGSETTPEIDTPNASIHPNGPGEYRVLVNSDAETQVIIRQGSADISTPQGSTHIDQGQMITVAGTDNPQYKTETAFARDDWDSWNADRDRRIDTAQSWQKTDRYYTGSEDLDTYGTWSEVPDYGPVWIPQQSPDWAPYRDGTWVYEPYYGWTWTSYEPWGWAPYHYGRWFMYGDSWAWWPGPVGIYPGYYPVWSPAYVSFFGFGGGGFGVGFGFGLGFGNYGWLPCGPGDWFHPWYGRWGGRFNSVTINNYNNFHQGFSPLGGNRGRQFSNINGALNNDRIRGGVSSMRGDQFGRGGVSAHQTPMSAASFRQASLISGKMPVTPSRESYSPSGRAANPSSFRNAPSSSQHFFTGGARTNTASGATSSRSSSFGTNRGSTSFSGHSAETMNSNHANSSGSAQSGRPGWRTFTPPQSGSASQGAVANSRGTVNNNARVFEAPSRQSSTGTGSQSSNSWEHFAPPASTSRGSSSNSYSRSPLDMRQPIVTRRGESSGSGSYYGGGTRSGSYNAPRPTYSAPRPTYTAPRPTYSAPRPTYSAPRSSGSYSGGRSSGGGGGRSSGGHSSSHR